ncbi:MAG: DUF4249 domain-containing protein [Chloroflexia bacterium]|nr:DUF4249 domain-containing protein [Chloroflexia bacterium]
MKYINILIISVLFFTSCEKTIYIKIEDQGRKLVVNSIFASDDSVHIQLLESKYIMDGTYQYFPVEDASISLFENQTEVETVSQNEFGNYLFSSKLTEAQQYSIVVNSTLHGTATAQSYLPDESKIDKIEYQLKLSGESEYKYIENAKFKVEFTDVANTENFYQIRAYTKYEEPIIDPNTNEIIGLISRKNFIQIGSEDPSVYDELYEIPGIFFSDELFDGQQHTISFETDYFNYNNDTQTIYFIQLNSLSKDLYNYYRSYSQYEETKDNPFAEPVKVYNNIENGFGIFGGYTTAVDSVEIDIPFKK